MRRRRLLPLVLGVLGITFAPGAPAPAEATPLACDDHCMIQAHFFAYIAPVTEVLEGARVHWQSLDVSHPTGELQGDSCFRAEMAGGTASTPVVFDIADGGGVTATSGTFGTRTCEGAVELPMTGSYALPYHCLLHPNMLGALVISPA